VPALAATFAVFLMVQIVLPTLVCFQYVRTLSS
jgi:hypothetical protein